MNEHRDAVSLAARRIIRRSRSAALATHQHNDDGHPYASLVTTACDMDGRPVMLCSELSDHTRNLQSDPHASLLFEEAANRQNPQTGPRITLCGTITRTDDKRLAARFLARHPDARMYAGFRDFGFYIMAVERLHWVGGFADARWMTAKDSMFNDTGACRKIADAAESIIDHMNTDHGDALDACARGLLGRKGSGWAMIGIDPEGFDICCKGRFARVDFDHPVTNARDCRSELVALAKRARIQMAR